MEEQNNEQNNKLELKSYKSWRAICEVMGWKTTGGTYKKARLKEFNSVCRYTKSGNTYTILEIYPEYEQLLNNKKHVNGLIFGGEIEELIIFELSKALDENKPSIILSRNQLFLKLNMINGNYYEVKNNLTKKGEEYDIPIETMVDFFNVTYRRNKNAIISALDRLEDKNQIFWGNTITLHMNDGSFREAKDQEIKDILSMENETLKEMNITDKKSLFISGRWREFKSNMEEKIDNFMNAQHYFYSYKIIPSTNFENSILKNEKIIENIRKSLNNKLCEANLKSAKTKHENVLKEYDFGLPTNKIKLNRMSDDYVNDIDKLNGYCLKNGYEDIIIDDFSYDIFND